MTQPASLDIDALWDYGQPAATEARFTEHVADLEASGELDPLLQLLTQIARAQGLQGHFTEANATLAQVQTRLTPDTPVAETRYLLERGRVLNSSGQPAQACDWFHRAYDLASAHHQDFYAIDALHMLAIADAPETQLAWNQQALAIARQATEPRAANWQGSLYNNLGWTYFEAEDFPQALSNFEQALQFRTKQGKTRETLIARWCVARTLRAMGRTEDALQMQQDIRAAWLAAGEVPDGYGTEEIAECLLTLGRPDEAQPYFASAYALFTKNGTLADQPERLQRLKQLGNVTEGQS
jgi:tetratricopeptide (TPR) repeat protein